MAPSVAHECVFTGALWHRGISYIDLWMDKLSVGSIYGRFRSFHAIRWQFVDSSLRSSDMWVQFLYNIIHLRVQLQRFLKEFTYDWVNDIMLGKHTENPSAWIIVCLRLHVNTFTSKREAADGKDWGARQTVGEWRAVKHGENVYLTKSIWFLSRIMPTNEQWTKNNESVC